MNEALNRPTYLLFANRKDIRLLNAENQRSNASIIVSQLEDAAAIDFYFADSIIFWTDIGLEMIKGFEYSFILFQTLLKIKLKSTQNTNFFILND